MANFNAISSCIASVGLPGGAPNALQYNAGGGNLGGIGPLSNGQLVIGVTGGPPQATTLTAGPGITITNSAGAIAISGSGGGPYTAPTAANFVWGNQPAGTTATDTSTGLAMFEPPQSGDNVVSFWDINGYPTSPSSAAPFVATLGFRGSMFRTAYQRVGLVIGDNTGKLIDVELGNDNGSYYYVINYWSSNTSMQNYSVHAYYPPAGEGIFVRIKDDGTNLQFGIGNDLNAIVMVDTVSRTAFLTSGPNKIGLFEDWPDNNHFGAPLGATFFHYNRSDNLP